MSDSAPRWPPRRDWPCVGPGERHGTGQSGDRRRRVRRPVVRFCHAPVIGIDLERRLVRAHGDEAIAYDYLVLATGSQNDYFGNSALEAHTLRMKTLPRAQRVRNHVLACLEHAAQTTDEAERRRWLTFVVIGGGPTGVEFTGRARRTAETGSRQRLSGAAAPRWRASSSWRERTGCCRRLPSGSAATRARCSNAGASRSSPGRWSHRSHRKRSCSQPAMSSRHGPRCVVGWHQRHRARGRLGTCDGPLAPSAHRRAAATRRPPRGVRDRGPRLGTCRRAGAADARPAGNAGGPLRGERDRG
jgi:hypothetical protein